MDIFRLAWREISRKKSRAALNILGFFIAVCVMVVLVSVLNISRDAQSSVLASTGTHFIAFAPYQETSDGSCSNCSISSSPINDSQLEGFIADNDFTNILPMSILDSIRKFPEVKDAAACLWYRLSDEKGSPYTIGGFDTYDKIAVASTVCSSTDITSGRFIDPGETGSVMAEQRYAYIKSINLGDVVRISGIPFKVTGIINAGIRPVKVDFYMNLTDAVLCAESNLGVGISDSFNILLVEAKNSKVHETAVQKVQALIGLSTVVSSYNCYVPAAKVWGMSENSVWLLTLIIGLAAILLSMKTQFSSAVERQHDIGILKSIGWRDRVIVTQMVIESALQAFIGGILGCLAGVAALFALPISSLTGSSAAIKPAPLLSLLLCSLLLTLAGGIIAGILPALSTVRKKPIDVLRRI